MPHTHSEYATGAGGCVPVPWVPDYRRWIGECMMEFRPYQVTREQAIEASLQKIWKSHSIPIQ